MTWFSGIIVYILIWWTALFAVLPIGTRPDADGDLAAGGWRGTPQNARIGWKLLGTTVLSAILWIAVWFLMESGWISFRSGPFSFPDQ
jgi:predicted secreted protein